METIYRIQNKKIKYLSLFAGIGGFELGIGDKGECIGYSEVDPECPRCTKAGRGKYHKKTLVTNTRLRCDTCGSEREHPTLAIYERHFDHKNFGDITKIDPFDLPDFDLLTGGFPCQAFSVAGHRRGFDDTRGTMFFEIARIVKEKRPRLLLLENVKGLLSHEKGETFFIILSTLDELGYDCQWQVLNSKDFGVPQNRERVFIIGHLRGTRRPEVFPLTKSDGKVYAPGDGKNNIAGCLSTKQNSGQLQFDGSTTLISLTPPDTADAFRIYDSKGIARTLKGESGGVGGKTGLYTTSPCLRANHKYAADIHFVGDIPNIRRLTPKECERLQGFPDGWTKTGYSDGASFGGVKISDSARYKGLGNAVTVTKISTIIEHILKEMI